MTLFGKNNAADVVEDLKVRSSWVHVMECEAHDDTHDEYVSSEEENQREEAGLEVEPGARLRRGMRDVAACSSLPAETVVLM